MPDVPARLDRFEALLSAVIIALARTWDSKLPGFLAEFRTQLDSLYVQTPVAQMELRNALEHLSNQLSDPLR